MTELRQRRADCSTKPHGSSSAGSLSPGKYRIGSDRIPHCGPAHWHTISSKVWIDAAPLSWAHFEVFVAAGGYRRKDLWEEAVQPAATEPLTASIDQRCRQLLEQTKSFRRSLELNPQEQRHLPLTGITWFEASAICRFYGARLPFEVEWEAAMQVRKERTHDSSECWAGYPTSDSDCKVFVGTMQEWTADAYQQQYWQADYDIPGRRWNPEHDNQGVVVRGASPQDLYQHVCYRMSRLPEEGDSFCGFRRVWEKEPATEQINACWRESSKNVF